MSHKARCLLGASCILLAMPDCSSHSTVSGADGAVVSNGGASAGGATSSSPSAAGGSTGDTSSTGGKTNAGGTVQAGGESGTAGAVATGGARIGGTTSMGGAKATGGNPGTGGAVGSGGSVTSGHAQIDGSAGGVAGQRSGTGGTLGSGGTTSTSAGTQTCTTPTAATARLSGKAFTGSHQITIETDPGVPGSTIYRPTDLQAGASYPILAWGEGSCLENGTDIPEFLGEIASHGYLVIADGTPGGTENRSMGGTNAGQPLLDYITWAVSENGKACSQYYQSLAASKIAVAGWSCGGMMAASASSDARITTWILDSSSGVSASVRTPGLIVLGGSDDIAYTGGVNNYDSITSAPVVLVSTPVGHVGTYRQDNGGSFAKVNLAWLDWRLKGDEGATGKGYLVGASCGLCSDTAWTIQSKNVQ